jgi:hypothetical protein
MQARPSAPRTRGLVILTEEINRHVHLREH